MTRYDISVAYGAATPPWPGDTPYSCGWAWDMATGASVNVGRVVTSWHVGTHADAPLHVSPIGAASELLPLAAFHGPATVVDARTAMPGSTITPEWLTGALEGRRIAPRLLLHTGCSVASGRFPDAWPTLTTDAVDWLTRGGLQ